jgi:hypothetical protein
MKRYALMAVSAALLSLGMVSCGGKTIPEKVEPPPVVDLSGRYLIAATCNGVVIVGTLVMFDIGGTLTGQYKQNIVNGVEDERGPWGLGGKRDALGKKADWTIVIKKGDLGPNLPPLDTPIKTEVEFTGQNATGTNSASCTVTVAPPPF